MAEYNYDDFESFMKPYEVPEMEPPSQVKRSVEIKLRGPFSSLETTICSLKNVDQSGRVAVDPLSVNSVLLASDTSVRKAAIGCK